MVGGELESCIVWLTNEIDPVAKPVSVSLSLPGVSGGSRTFLRAQRRAIGNPRSLVHVRSAYGILIRGVKVTNGIAYIRDGHVYPHVAHIYPCRFECMSSRRRTVLHPVSLPLLIGFVGPRRWGGRKVARTRYKIRRIVLPTRRKKRAKGDVPRGL